jgi:hypothetical protein
VCVIEPEQKLHAVRLWLAHSWLDSTVCLDFAPSEMGTAASGRDFGGMRKLSNGKYYLMSQTDGQSSDASLALAASLWQFSIGQYAPEQPAGAAAAAAAGGGGGGGGN